MIGELDRLRLPGASRKRSQEADLDTRAETSMAPEKQTLQPDTHVERGKPGCELARLGRRDHRRLLNRHWSRGSVGDLQAVRKPTQAHERDDQHLGTRRSDVAELEPTTSTGQRHLASRVL